MSCNKRGFFYCIWFSLFVILPCAASYAQPDQRGGPPSPPDQGMHGEDPKVPDPKGAPDKTLVPPPPKDPDKIYYYRGNRAYSEEQPLKVDSVSCSKEEDDSLIMLIVFNQSVNPRTVNNKSILINSEELPETTRFSFNKKGDTIRFVLSEIEIEEEIEEETETDAETEDEAEVEDEIRIKVKNVTTFNGVRIEPVELLVKVEG